MKKLEYGGKIGIFLDHRELFNKMCREYTTPNTTIYELRTELFNFQARENHTSVEVSIEKRKRKRNVPDETATIIDQRLLQYSQSFLAQLKHGDKQTAITSNLPLTRYWEETHHNDFPTFHGANETGEFQTFKYKNQCYIIPPKCRFFNYNVLELTKLVPQLSSAFDLVVIDPPWRNKYIRRLKRAREQLAYPMLEDSQLESIPIGQLIHRNTIVAIWCTNSKQHQDALCMNFLPAWNLRLLHSLKWLKLNTNLTPIGPINSLGQKQPYEMLYIACHRDSDKEFAANIRNVELLLSVPSIVHSHKPPLLPWLQSYLPNEAKCLEIFARYFQPNFTAIGLEVLKLMDCRLYGCQ